MFRSVERVRAAARGRTEVSTPVVTPPLMPLRGFRADVQALRGVAVLAVVLYHAQVVVPGGFVGVDVFFVISGFVIGRGLLSEFVRTGRMSFAAFYVRRARRLLPALSVLLVVTVLAAPLFASLDAGEVTRSTAVAAALFSANRYLYGATEDGYFAADAELNPLLHTWSLSVEEQFYFAVPILLVLAWRFGVRRANPLTALRVVIGLLLVVSFVACLVFSYSDTVGSYDGPRFAFYAPFTRAWQFAAGLALVVLPTSWLAGRQLRRALFAAGAVLLGLALFVLDHETLFPGLAALLPTVGTVLLIHAGTTAGEDHQPTPAALRPLVWLGDLSYSWYLWHWPLIVFAAALAPAAGAAPLVVAAFAALAPAWLSYRTLERRIRLRAPGPRRRTAWVAVACIATPLAAAGLSATVSEVVTEQLPAESYASSQRRHADRTTDPRCDRDTPLDERDPDECLWDFSGDSDGADPAEPTDPAEPADAVDVLLVGDSNAGHISEAAIGTARAEGYRLRIATLSACRFVLFDVPEQDDRSRECRRFVDGAIDAIEADPPDLVVLATATDHALFPDEPRRERAILTGVLAEAGDPVGSEHLEAGLERAVERIRAVGSEVALVATVPKLPDWDARSCSRLTLTTALDRCLPPVASRHNPIVSVANALEERVAADTGIPLVDLNPTLCPGPEGVCPPVIDGVWQWRDEAHISVAATERLVPAFRDRVAPLVRS